MIFNSFFDFFLDKLKYLYKNKQQNYPHSYEKKSNLTSRR